MFLVFFTNSSCHKYWTHIVFCRSCENRPGICSNPTALINLATGSDEWGGSECLAHYSDTPADVKGEKFSKKKGTQFSDEKYENYPDYDSAHAARNKEASHDNIRCSNSESNLSKSSIVFTRGQLYEVIVHLDLPDCVQNRDLGMFQVEVSFHSKDKLEISTSSRKVIMPYKSNIQRLASGILKLPSLLFAASYPETQLVKVPVFDHFMDDPTHAAHYMKVVVQSRFVHIESCSVEVHAVFRGLRYYLYNYPVLCGVCGTLLNMCAILSVLIAAWIKKMVSMFTCTGVYLIF